MHKIQTSQRTLEETPQRVLRFLRAAANRPFIRGKLNEYGFTNEDQAEGWRLLHAASGFGAEAAPALDDGGVRAAIDALDEWDEDGFRLARAALVRRHPEQAERVFHDLEATRGAGAVIGVQRFLERLDELEAGTEADRAALATLATRGIDATERERLAGLLAVAQSAPEVTLPDEEELEAARDAQREKLEALRAWFMEWSETARSVIKRKDHLISLGLARRNRVVDSELEGDELEEVLADAS